MEGTGGFALATAADFDGLSLADVRQQGKLAGTVDLDRELALMLGTKVRRALREDLPEPIHILL
jgi:hypothetical protein